MDERIATLGSTNMDSTMICFPRQALTIGPVLLDRFGGRPELPRTQSRVTGILDGLSMLSSDQTAFKMIHYNAIHVLRSTDSLCGNPQLQGIVPGCTVPMNIPHEHIIARQQFEITCHGKVSLCGVHAQ